MDSMDSIVWKQIRDYPTYDVSTCGKIRNNKTQRVLIPCMRNGYLSVSFSSGNKKKTVNIHVIVAQTFLNKPDDTIRYVVNHINENKQDNNIDNLEYVTYAQNIKHSSTPSRTFNNKDYNLSEFTDIPNYNKYMISKTGDIYSKQIKRLLVHSRIPSGYLKIKLKSDNSTYNDIYIHVLIAITYLQYTPTTRNIVINHKDGNKQNNVLDNLEIITQQQNAIHSTQINNHKIFRRSVYYMKDNNVIEYISAKEASIDTNIDHSSIIKSCKSQTKLAGNIKWFYMPIKA